MKLSFHKINVIFLWFFAILMVAVNPVEANESLKEVEETEEIRLYFQDGKHVRQKPKSSQKSLVRKRHTSHRLPTYQPIHHNENRKYIRHCNLIYYH